MTRRGQRCLVAGILAAGVAVLAGMWLGAWNGGRFGDTSPTPASWEGTGPQNPAHRTTQVRAAPVRRHTTQPVRLDIPAIQVSTHLVGLGLEPDRTVEVPTNPDRAGWFTLGPSPGAPGSSVVLGHVDSIAGPAVFARLEYLEQGDVVKITRSDGSVITFEVRRLAQFDNADFPAERVYAATGARRLNLVTCSGDYVASQGGYQSNLVVFTRRTPPEELVGGSAAAEDARIGG